MACTLFGSVPAACAHPQKKYNHQPWLNHQLGEAMEDLDVSIRGLLEDLANNGVSETASYVREATKEVVTSFLGQHPLSQCGDLIKNKLRTLCKNVDLPDVEVLAKQMQKPSMFMTPTPGGSRFTR